LIIILSVSSLCIFDLQQQEVSVLRSNEGVDYFVHLQLQ